MTANSWCWRHSGGLGASRAAHLKKIGANLWVSTTTPLHDDQGTITKAFYQPGSG